jgi:hypothetical protein
MLWKQRKATTATGEYSTGTVTQHFTTDGAFTITPTGGMRYCRAHGVHGDRYNRFVWSGYTLDDNRTDRPEWVRSSKKFTTVAAAKREAERRMRGK